MYGLAAIQAANGWMITIAGISIVFAGLLILSSVLQYMERILRLWDRRRQWLPLRTKRPTAVPIQPSEAEAQAEAEKAVEASAALPITIEERDVIRQLQMLSELQGPVFALPKLLETAEKRGISRPHHHLDMCLELGLIVESTGANCGFYTWSRKA